MVNTFLELEPLAVRALQSDSRLPRVYPVGPILKPGGPEGREVVEWLDRQPDGSVYAEQQVNAFLLVRELGLAEAVRIEYSTDFRGDRPPEIVAAPEIEAAVRRLMGGGGGVVREKVKELKMKSREAMEESKSAYEAQKSFIEDVIRNVGG
ncbi:UDP-glycosyltransferase 71D1 [Striga hermonthica]|uniref:UDP-glycosyltransferase 71D1 n=1 Tax=Striga hermonthica TaxID=68872 RepID=A0A9N7MN27_STRHE|nr:UDP-glycosyltransferase 71D1 [Striga hermonthica]